MKLEKIKLIIGIIIGVATICGIVIGFDRYFAKSEDVESQVKEIEAEHKKLEIRDELVQERLDMAITDDQIFQQQQQIQQMKNLHIFEQKAELKEMSPMEKEALSAMEERLSELKAEKVLKAETYNKMRK